MLTVTRPEETEQLVRTTPEGATIRVREFIGSVSHLHRGPQAFFSAFEPGYVIDPHYHLGDQFQIFVEGSSRIADHRLDPVTVHYSDAYTAYGPIICGDHGMSFFNLRARCDLGAEYMPASRKGMHIRGGRSITAHCRMRLGDDVPTMRLETVIDLHEDGLAAYEILAAPGVRLLDAPAAGNGRFQIVLDGSLEMDGETLPRHSVAAIGAGDRFGPRAAGGEGAHVLEVQFPKE
jgi:hypothetical protein